MARVNDWWVLGTAAVKPIVAADMEEQTVQHVDVTVTTAQVLALFLTPIQIVAAPGANKANILLGCVLHKPAGTAYGGIAAGEDLVIKYTNAAGLTVGSSETTGFLDQAGVQTRFMHPYSAATLISDITPVANAILVIHILIAEIITGTSDLLLRVYYRTVPTVLT